MLGKRPLARIVGMQREYRDAMARVLDEGTKKGVFHVADAKTTTMLILDAANGLREWYRAESGPIEELAETYADLALRICGAADRPVKRTNARR